MFLALLSAMNLLVMRSMFLRLLESLGDWQDGLSKIAQIGFIHAKSKTADQAVALQLELEAKPGVAEPPEPKRKIIGVRGPNGEVIHFSRGARPDDATIAKIPKDRLVYQQ